VQRRLFVHLRASRASLSPMQGWRFSIADARGGRADACAKFGEKSSDLGSIPAEGAVEEGELHVPQTRLARREHDGGLDARHTRVQAIKKQLAYNAHSHA